MTASAWIRVAGAAALGPGEARTFSFEREGETLVGFVLAVATAEFRGIVAFANRCAHVGFDLDMGTGRFWSTKMERIYCMTHGACFRPSDGVCDRGPCVGQSLQGYEVRMDGADALVRAGDPEAEA